MSNTTKSHWVTDANSVRITMPIAKVDQDRRLVSGYATLDNVDSQGDIVLAEASAKAFARARGNIREMHQPIAVGKMVDFVEDEYYDSTDKKFYRGIYVTAYVSKGAESTWEKVLDGTLTGFSIGGNIKEFSNEFVKDANGGEGANIRFIKDYDLVELSLVDNPANQLANVFSIQKAADGSVTMKGMMVDTPIENIFWCETDSVARTENAESAACLICGSQMKNIGWVESGEQKAEKVREIVDKFLSQSDHEAVNDAQSEGGVEVSKFIKSDETKENEEVVAGVDEEQGDTTAPVADSGEGAVTPDLTSDAQVSEDAEATNDGVEEGEVVAGVDEVADEQEEVSKKLDTMHEAIMKSLNDTREATENAVAEVDKKVEELSKTLDAKTSEFEGKIGELSTNLEAAKGIIADFEKSLESINSADAVKKSADLEKSAETKQKENLWGGAFSVNNLIR